MPRAFITGITGQDGSYLAELLLEKGYEVHGVFRRSSSVRNTWRIDHILDRIYGHHSDLLDGAALMKLFRAWEPDEVYNLAAQSHVGVSFETPYLTGQVTALGALNVFEAVRFGCPRARVYQASSSEQFGAAIAPQNEASPFLPQSPYAAAKTYAHTMAHNYRNGYGMHISCGILFNHESPRRGETFVTRKIARGVAAIARGERKGLMLGELKARRDWGWAPEYVETMWKMLQRDLPGDFVVATGESHSVQDFCEVAFAHVGLDWREHVGTAVTRERPLEVWHLRGDAEKARAVLGWQPKVRFHELVHRMVDAEMSDAR